MKVERDEVFDVLDGEREYQIEKWGERVTPIGDFLVYMQDYLTQAFNQATRVPGPDLLTENTLATIRKVTALGVACMEQWGAPSRQEVNPITDPTRLLPASPIEDGALDAALPEPPSADPGGGHAEPPAEVYPEWVELAAREAAECDEDCGTEGKPCSYFARTTRAIWDAYQRGYTDGDLSDQGLGEEVPF